MFARDVFHAVSSDRSQESGEQLFYDIRADVGAAQHDDHVFARELSAKFHERGDRHRRRTLDHHVVDPGEFAPAIGEHVLGDGEAMKKMLELSGGKREATNNRMEMVNKCEGE